MRSLNCLSVQNAHSVFFVCEDFQCIQSVVQNCVYAYSKTVIVLGTSSGYSFGSHFSKHFLCNPYTNSLWADQQFWTEGLAVDIVWHHQLGWQYPTSVLRWKRRYPSTDLRDVKLLCHSGAETGSAERMTSQERELRSRQKLLTGPWRAIMSEAQELSQRKLWLV